MCRDGASKYVQGAIVHTIWKMSLPCHSILVLLCVAGSYMYMYNGGICLVQCTVVLVALAINCDFQQL